MITSLFIAMVFAGGQFFSVGAIAQARNTIDGQVMTPERRPIVNARVFLQNDAYSEIATVYTDGSGRFTFRGVASGTYNILVDPTDGMYERQSQRIEAVAINGRSGGRGGEIFRTDFILKPRRLPGDEKSGATARSSEAVFYQEVPEAARRAYAAGIKSIEENDADRGIESLKQALELFPDYYDALEQLGSEYVRRHDFNSAVPILEHATEINKNAWPSYYYLGVARVELKQADEGVKALRRAIEINPNSINANMRLGMILVNNKETYAEALKSFEKVAALAGKQVPDAYLYLAKLYAEKERYKEAVSALETYIKLNPEAETQLRERYKKVLDQMRQKARS